MELKQELEIQARVSQEMVQAVSILQMTAWDLKEYVQEAMLENPVIELEETTRKQDNEEIIKIKYIISRSWKKAMNSGKKTNRI